MNLKQVNFIRNNTYFMPNHSNIHNAKLNVRAGAIAITVAFFLVLIKLFAWIQTDSLSVFSSLIDSSLDVATSLINFLAIGYALKPADEDHPYGHESIEDIVGLVQASFIFGSACFICYEGIQRFIDPVAVEKNLLGIQIMLVSILLTTALVIYQKIVVKKTKSLVVESDSAHYVSDILSGILIIISLFISSNSNLHYVDPFLALIIAAFISYSAYGIGKRAFDNLMNKEISADDKGKIIALIESNKNHNGFHDFKTRCSGNKIFIQFDLELDGDLSLQRAHDISDEIMIDIMKHYPTSEVVIHFDTHKD
jgi:ferrous-iron efflux pump FieF